MNYTFETLVMALLAFAALLGVAFAHDSLFAAHMWVAFFVLAGGHDHHAAPDAVRTGQGILLQL